MLLAAFLGLLLFAFPTGQIPPDNGMWRCGPFLFYPSSFFTMVGVVAVSTGCVLFGTARGKAFEIVGWILLGIMIIFTLMVSMLMG